MNMIIKRMMIKKVMVKLDVRTYTGIFVVKTPGCWFTF